MAKPIEKKVVIVGDGSCGKTSFYQAIKEALISEGIIIKEDEEFYRFTADIEIDGIQLKLQLCDVTGNNQYDRLRRLDYINANLMVICLSVHTCYAFDLIIDLWIPEIRKFMPKVPYIFIGTQKDLRDDAAAREKVLKDLEEDKRIRKYFRSGKSFDIPYEPEDGLYMAEKLKAVSYLECSAKTKEGVPEVLKTIIELVLATKEKQSCSKCVVL